MTTKKLLKEYITKILTKAAKHYNGRDDEDGVSMDAEVWWKETKDNSIVVYYRTMNDGSLEQDSYILILKPNKNKDSLNKVATIHLEDTDMVKYSTGFKYMEVF